MGRRRRSNLHLPQRMYLRRGTYIFAPRTGPWKALGKDYREALKRYAALVDAGAPCETIAQLIGRYQLEELPKLSANHARNRRHEFERILAVFGEFRADEIQPHHGFEYVRSHPKPKQGRHELRALSALLTYARQVGALHTPNPLFDLKLPPPPARDRYVTDEEFLAMRERVPAMVGYAMDLAYVAGLDQGTILKLERGHVTETGIVFERGKTGKLQQIDGEEIALTVRAALREAPQFRRFVICRRDGKPYTSDGFRTIWQRHMARFVAAGGARFTFHDLRAKSASDSATDQEASDRLGHSSLDITRRVYRRLPRRAAALKILT